MNIDFETSAIITKISTGQEGELQRGKLVSQIIDIDEEVKKLRTEKIKETKEYYEKLIGDRSVKNYNVDTLLEEIETIKKEFMDFIHSGEYQNHFEEMINATEEFFMNAPFEGLDGAPYGVGELCVYSTLEYSCNKVLGYDHDWHRMKYEESLVRRTGPDVAEFWMKLYDGLQARYDSLDCKYDNEVETRLSLTMCSLIAVVAIGNQNEQTLDITRDNARNKANVLLDAIDNDTYTASIDYADDNGLKLAAFIRQEFLSDAN